MNLALKPTPSPSHTPTPKGSSAPAADTSGGGFDAAAGVFHWLVAHWGVPLALVLWIGVLYGWRQLRMFYAQKGRAVRPLGAIVRDIVRFAVKEDKRPLIGKPKKVAAKMAWLTGSRFYLAMLALAVAGFVSGWYSPGWPLIAFVLVLWGKASPVFKARNGVMMQMFAVAAAEAKYPKGSEMSPWGYINIRSWENLTSPGETIVSYPPAYQSEDEKARDKFERQFNGTISDENTWTYVWESSKNRVICKPTSFLPTMAKYPGPGSKWNEFVLGSTGKDSQAVWDVSTFPHALICGPTGSGKSVLQRMILFHALAHSDTWKIVGVDPKMVEMGWLTKYPNVLKIALTLEDGVEVVQSVRDEMMRRYDEMSSLGVNHFQSLENPPPALLCMVDEVFNFLAPEGVKSDEGKERDALHMRGTSLLGEIARLGRAAGVHLALATQRPDATVIKGEMKNNLDCRIAAGRLDTTPSLMVLDSEAATRLPKIRGRAMIRLGGDMTTFQGYFEEQNWYDRYAEAKAAGLLDGPADDAPQQRSSGGGLLGLLRSVLARLVTRRPKTASAGQDADIAAEPDDVAVELPLDSHDPADDGTGFDEVQNAAQDTAATAPEQAQAGGLTVQEPPLFDDQTFDGQASDDEPPWDEEPVTTAAAEPTDPPTPAAPEPTPAPAPATSGIASPFSAPAGPPAPAAGLPSPLSTPPPPAEASAPAPATSAIASPFSAPAGPAAPVAGLPSPFSAPAAPAQPAAPATPPAGLPSRPSGLPVRPPALPIQRPSTD